MKRDMHWRAGSSGTRLTELSCCPGVSLWGAFKDSWKDPKIEPPFGAVLWSGDSSHLQDQVRYIQRQTAEKILVVLLAGLFSQCVYSRRSLSDGTFRGGHTDHLVATEVLQRWFSAEDRVPVSRLAEQRTSALVRSRKGWVAASTIAAALLETGELSGCELSAICASAFETADPPGSRKHGWPMSPRDIRAASS